MPTCRNCHSRLNKFDKDICPVCGCKNPFMGMPSDTIEITQEIGSIPDVREQYRPKKRKFAVILSLFVGFSGATFFYLGYYLSAILYLCMNIIIAGCLFLALYFGLAIDVYICLGVCIGILYLVNIVLAGIFIYRKDIKDSRGELLK